MSAPEIMLEKNKNKNDDNNLLENEEIKDSENIDINDADLSQNKEKKKESYSIKYGRYAVSAFTGSVSFTTNAASI